MIFTDVLKFKSPNRIHWLATEEAVYEYVRKHWPGMSPSEVAMTTTSFMNKLRKITNKYRVPALYTICQEANRPAYQVDEQLILHNPNTGFDTKVVYRGPATRQSDGMNGAMVYDPQTGWQGFAEFARLRRDE